jgi:RsiW-degrading membrane proteinase PrsW (M82 family)
MTTAWGGILPKGQSGGDSFCYLLAAMSGVLAGWLDIKVGDLLLTAMVVLAANMLLGFISPHRPWRWVLVIGAFVPVVEWLAYFYLTQKPERAQIFESFLAFLPGIAGAYGGAMGRGVVDNLFARK